MSDDLPLPEPPLAAPEAAMLRAFLDYQRQVVRRKLAGLDRVQLATTVAPSPMTLGGLAKHLAFVESWWTRETIDRLDALAPFDTAPWDDDHDWDWHSAVDDDPDELRALLDRAIAESDRIVDATLADPHGAGLDTESARFERRTGAPFTLRWILIHLIEEYARHLGHADYLREAVDGQTGD